MKKLADFEKSGGHGKLADFEKSGGTWKKLADFEKSGGHGKLTDFEKRSSKTNAADLGWELGNGNWKFAKTKNGEWKNKMKNK